MAKLACLFPGQGSQSVGMGKDLYENCAEAKTLLDQFDQFSKASSMQAAITTLCFDGPDTELKRTINTQPTIMAVSLAAWACYVQKGGPKPHFVAGHSLGEISALAACGTLSNEDAFKLVLKRASLMENCPKGAMAAVLKLSASALKEVVDAVSTSEKQVVIANLNTHEQLVISGNPDAVSEACAKVKEKGGKAIPLPVGGAFHSPLMHEASVTFSELLKETNFGDAKYQVVQNFDAKAHQKGDELKANLDKQMENAVRWYESIEYMVSQGVDTFVEIGPGAVLTGLVKKIDANVRVFNINDKASLEATLENLKLEGALT
ncbi:MAG: ACP S-malonyltransferase [Candidatus Melainabacteria bacterium]|nr:ACP S-malonyltransferase [Candidatus Melainabacteria bacterium]